MGCGWRRIDRDLARYMSDVVAMSAALKTMTIPKTRPDRVRQYGSAKIPAPMEVLIRLKAEDDKDGRFKGASSIGISSPTSWT